MNLNLNFKAYDYSATPAQTDLKALLGGLLSADWRQALIARGFGWHFDVGAFQTPIVGGGNGTSFDQDQPEFGASCPTGYALIPLRIEVSAQPGVQTTDNHVTDILIAADVAAAGAGLNSTNGTVETPTNMRSGFVGSGCPLTVASALTMNITNPTLGHELARATKRMNFGDATGLELMEAKVLYEPRNAPIFIGPCCLYGYWGGDVAVSGYASVDLLVIPSALITGLV